MNFKEEPLPFDEYFYLLKQAAQGKKKALTELGLTQIQALELLQDEDVVAYRNVLHYLITVIRENGGCDE